MAEAALYRYDGDSDSSEEPVKEHDHALDALRYLVSKLDDKKMARMRRGKVVERLLDVAMQAQGPNSDVPAKSAQRKWLSIYNDALWTRIV